MNSDVDRRAHEDDCPICLVINGIRRVKQTVVRWVIETFRQSAETRPS